MLELIILLDFEKMFPDFILFTEIEQIIIE